MGNLGRYLAICSHIPFLSFEDGSYIRPPVVLLWRFNGIGFPGIVKLICKLFYLCWAMFFTFQTNTIIPVLIIICEFCPTTFAYFHITPKFSGQKPRSNYPYPTVIAQKAITLCSFLEVKRNLFCLLTG